MNRHMRRVFAHFIIAAGACIAAPDVTHAQHYPTKPVRVIVAFAPGGGSDFIARLIGQKLGEALGQQVIVDNRPGGGASIGFEYGLRSPADGYTLTQITPSYTINPSVRPVKFDALTDYTPVVMEGKGPLAVLAHPSLPAHSARQLIALAKSKPDQIIYGTAGQGTIVHLATELFLYMGEVKMVNVPYKGGAPALVDLMAGQIQLVWSPPQTGMPYARAGKLRALGMTSAKRTRADPDVPTIAESGLPGYEATNWHALIGPKGMPRPVVERLNGEIRKIVATKEMEKMLQANGIEPDGSTPEQLAAYIRRDFEQWRNVITRANIKVD
jgi:tripartite-type tricarboxylate transporter receptor subunit TctC